MAIRQLALADVIVPEPINDLAGRTFAARDVAHRAHWATSSFSQHAALDEFYNGVIEAIDAIVEAYQGEFGAVGYFPVRVPDVTDVTAYLTGELQWVKVHRDLIAKGSTSVQNLIDELISVYQKTIYKLTNLS